MASLKVECRKFSPNIFNKSKCQNCFRGKDAHSPEALESNRATRKVTCRGYLFVAPDWDFSLRANRNKRWQRRWFVLYDDGELAYCVDEHPETVPQCVIDMTRVLEVSDAEGVTGNPFALALTCPDKVHFVKGTSREETRKWFEVLSKFPRNTVCGKYRRNATFPCVKSTLEMQPVRKESFSKQIVQNVLNDLYPTKDTDSQDQKKNVSTVQDERSSEEDPVCLHIPIAEQTTKTGEWEELKGRRVQKSFPDVLRDPPIDKTTQVRGDPDGCNPDSLDQNEFLKKGWLVQQQEDGGEWNRHWFVLRNCALASYADPLAEEAGVLDALLDLRQVKEVAPDPHSPHIFYIQMKDSPRRLLLSAVTAKVRGLWVRALSAAAAPAPASPPPARSALSRVKERSRHHRSTRRCCSDVKEERLEEWSVWLDVSKFCLGAGREEAELPHPASIHSGTSEIRRLQAQLRSAQAQADGLELAGARLRQAAAQAERLHASQMELMAARVEDLTAKLLAAERQVRQLRQRVAKLETRRRSSLKGKEGLSISKEYEAKLCELEAKIERLLGVGGEEEENLLARLNMLDKKVADAMPKIRLQVNMGESSDKWNSLSLSTSMTDLSEEKVLEAAIPDKDEVWEELERRVAALEAWTRSALGHKLQHSSCTRRSLRWLQEAAESLFCKARPQLNRACRLRRLELALEGLAQFLEQQPPPLSLCALAARLSEKEEEVEEQQEEELRRRVELLRSRVRAALSAYKTRCVERLCTALRELAEEVQPQTAHFLTHVVAQVAGSFDDAVARSLFPWIGGAAAQLALVQLSAELRELCALPPTGCGVLLEYARCAVAQLSRATALAALADAAADAVDEHRTWEASSWTSSLCDPDQLGVCHRSICSLLCFKRKWSSHCRSCTELRQEVSYLQGELEESRAISGALCEQSATLRAQQEMQFNEERKNLENELQTTKNNLKKIELHYDEAVHQLQLEYEGRLQQSNELWREESCSQVLLDQLKAVWERGLSALDSAHQKALGELEHRHQRELQELASERQRALADEAHATALAVEAVRRAHAEELQRRMQSFKEEWTLRKEDEAFWKCYESDLAKVKCEITTMAEKYSLKCLETAALHQRLEVVSQQLNSTTTQVVDLVAKNQQLRTRFVSTRIQKD